MSCLPYIFLQHNLSLCPMQASNAERISVRRSHDWYLETLQPWDQRCWPKNRTEGSMQTRKQSVPGDCTRLQLHGDAQDVLWTGIITSHRINSVVLPTIILPDLEARRPFRQVQVLIR